MNTQWTTRVRLTAFAAGLALTGIAGTPAHAADTRPVAPLSGWSGKLGPGIGSVKSPFGVLQVGTPLSGKSDDTLYFHTVTGQPAQQAPVRHLGPGPWSVRSPGSDRL